MSKEKITNLIFSPTVDQKTMSKKLAKWIKKDPSLLEVSFFRNKNILHLLVLENKAQVLDKLLQNEIWSAKALAGDKKGDTILHYAAKRPEDSSELLDILLKYLPSQLNTPNKLGNTPLHEAVLANRLWAVKRLVKNKHLDRSLKNLSGETAMSLAGANSALKPALLHIELPAKQAADRRHQPHSPSPEALSSLRKTFPLLSSGSESNESIPTLSTLDSSQSFTTYDSSSSGSYMASETEEEDEDNVYLDQMSRQLDELIRAYQADCHSPAYRSLHEQFNQNCTLYGLSDDFALQEITADRAAARAVISQTLDALHPLVMKNHQQIQHKMNSLSEMFTYMLASNNLMAYAEPRAALQRKSESPYKAYHLAEQPGATLEEMLWLLTACQERLNSKREFDANLLKIRVLSLLCTYSLVEILIGLRILYPALDHDQQTIANYLIVHLLFNHANDRLKLSPVINTHLRFIYKLNADKLGALGEQINLHLEKAFALSSLLNNQPLLRNFNFLNQSLNQGFSIKSKPSFDALVDQALRFTREQRTAQVLSIAHELQMITLSFYQHVSLHEFKQGNWHKAERHACSPQIVVFTDFFNKLSAYFIKKILAQPAYNMQNALQFVLDLFPILCPFHPEKYHDLHSVMLLGSIFNNHALARLTTVFTELPSLDQERVAEINRLVSSENNCKYMRQMYSTYPKTLPFIGHLLSDLTFANDGNKNDLVRLEVVGGLLKTLMTIKLLTNFTRSDNHTNLPEFIAHYEVADEETLYADSLRHKNRATDIIDLDKPTPDLVSFIANLEQNYLSKNILPAVLINKTQYPPSQLANKLMEWFAKKLPSSDQAGSELPTINHMVPAATPMLRQSLAKFKALIEQIISINNTFYRTTELNPLFFAAQFKKLTQQMSTLEAQPPTPDKVKQGEKRSLSKRMSLRFLDKIPLKQSSEATREFDTATSADAVNARSKP